MKIKSILNSFKSGAGTYSVIALTSIGCHVVSYVYSIITKRYVMPYEYGIYTTANMLLLYMNYLQLGVLNAYNRDYPQLLGAGKNEEAAHLKNSVFTFLTAFYLLAVVLTGAVVFALWQMGLLNDLLFGGFLFNDALAFLTVLSNFWDNTSKSEKHFLLPSASLILKTLLLVGSGIILVRRFNYWGLLAAALLSLLLSLTVYWRGFLRIRFVWDRKAIRKLIKTGILLMINSLIWTLMMSIDKFVILSFMNYEALGIYSAALIGFSTLVMIPQSLSSVFYVRLSHHYGAEHDPTSLVRLINRYTCAMSLAVSVVSVVAYYLLPPFIALAMPAYVDGVQSAQLLVMGVAVYSASMLYGHFFTILRKNIKLLRNTILLCLFNIILSSGMVMLFGRDIQYVALGTTISYGLYGLMLCFAMTRESKCRFWDCAFNSVFPVCVSIGIIKLSDLLPAPWYVGMLLAFAGFAVFALLVYRKTIRLFLSKD